eukprot:1100921-Amorphochlora_amoeboformis.AAC.2
MATYTCIARVISRVILPAATRQRPLRRHPRAYDPSAKTVFRREGGKGGDSQESNINHKYTC